MTTTKATKKPTKQPARVKRVRHNLQEQHRWELFAAAALASVAHPQDDGVYTPEPYSLDAEHAAKVADAMVEEWRKRWGKK